MGFTSLEAGINYLDYHFFKLLTFFSCSLEWSPQGNKLSF